MNPAPDYTILIVDDQVANLDVLANLLESHGFGVLAARDGETALDIAQRAQPDLILLDVILPGIDGFETCRCLKADKLTESIPVIFMTVLEKIEDKVKGFQLGAVDYTTKPFQAEEVIARVTTQLRLRSLARELQEANARLERRVIERTTQLTQVNNDLQAEVVERQSAEAALRESEARWRSLTENSPDHILILDQELNIEFANYASPGLTVEELIGTPLYSYVDEDRQSEIKALHEQVLKTGQPASYETEYDTPDGSIIYYESQVVPRILYGKVIGLTVSARDITTRKQAEKERIAHLRFLEGMDQVNRAIQGTNDLEQMMSDVLDAVLSIFDCDRAFLMYPCDPEAAVWRVPMEHTKPEYPGALALGVVMPMDADVAASLRILRESDRPVKFGPRTKYPLPTEVAAQFGFKTFMSMALYPKVGQPWQFGIHQCSYPRIWTPEEERLLREIGQRLADGLTSLLMFRNLQESEHKLAEAQRVAHVGHWDHDLGTDCITGSAETCRIFGLSPDAPSLTLTRFLDLIHPEDRQAVVQTVESAIRDISSSEGEYRVVRPTGEVRFVYFQWKLTKGGPGQSSHLFGTVQDITERKQAEETLRLNNFALERTSDAVYWINSTTIVDVNAAACRMLGYSRNEFIGMPVMNIDLLLSESEIASIWEQIKQNGALTFETQHKTKDGQIVPVEIMTNYIAFEGKELNCCFVRDITKRKRAEQALRRSNALLRAIIEAAPTAIIGLDLDGRVQSVWNPAAEKMLGWRAQEVMGNLLPSVPADSQEEFQDILEQVRRGESVEGVEARRQKRDGSPIDYSIYASPLHDAEDHLIGVISVLVDVTERKRMEQTLITREKEYRTLVEHVPDLIVRYDMDLRRVYANPAWEKTTGLSAREVINVPPADLHKVYNPIVTAYEEKLREVLRTGSSQSIEFSWVNAHGVTLFLEYIMVPEYDQYRELTGILSVGRDTTERRQAEEVLRRHDAMLQTLNVIAKRLLETSDWYQAIMGTLETLGTAAAIDNITIFEIHALEDGIIQASVHCVWSASQSPYLTDDNHFRNTELMTIDITDNIEKWNRRQPIYGHVRNLPLPKQLWLRELGVLSYLTMPIVVHNKFWGGIGFQTVQEECAWSSGEIEVIQAIASMLGTNIERQQNEEQLRQSEQRFRRGIQESPFPLMMHAEAGEVLLISDTWTEITGYTFDEISTIAEWTEKAFGNRKHITRTGIERLYHQNHRIHEGEFTIMTKNGQSRIWDFSSAPLGTLPDGRRLVLSMAMDITERKQIEVSEREQRQIAQALSAQLIDAQEAERNRLSRELHDEIGQLLLGVNVNLSIIEQRLPLESLSVVYERITEIRLINEQLLDQVRQLSRDLRPIMLDTLGLVPALRSYVEDYANRWNIKVSFDALGIAQSPAQGIALAIYRVVQESLTNIGKHAQASAINIRLEGTPTQVKVTIEDNGIGFNVKEVLEHKDCIHGIGLLGMKERVAALRGNFIIQSQSGRGTQVIVEIPFDLG